MLMSVSSTRYGMVVGLAAGAVLLAGCGGSGGSKNNADASTAPSAPPSAAPTDSASAAPTDGAQPSGAPSGGAGSGYTGPTVGPGHKCNTVTVVTGSIQCSHAEKIFELYAQNKKPDGKATFNGWSCVKETVGVICSRSGIRLRSAA
jgi:hypothetical protein